MKKIFAAICLVLALACIAPRAALAGDPEKAGGGGIFSENPVLEKYPDLDGSDGLWLPLLFTWQRDTKQHRTSFLHIWPFPPIFESVETNRGFKKISLWPLFSYEESEPDTYQSFNMFFSAFSVSSNKKAEMKAVSLFPLFFRVKRKDSGYNVLFPLVWHYWWDNGSGYYAWPFYGQGRWKDYEWTSALFPLYLESRDKEWGSSLHLLWPVFNYRSGPGHHGLRVFPFIFYNRREADEVYPYWTDRARLLALSGTKSASSGWGGGSETSRTQKGVSGARLLGAGLPAFCYKKKRSDYLVVFPFYWNMDFGETTHFHIWPFYGHDTGPRRWEQHSVLFPFFRYSTQAVGNRWKLSCPWPVFSMESGDIWVGKKGGYEFFGRRKNADVLFLFSYASDPARTEIQIYPLFKNVDALALFKYSSISYPEKEKERTNIRILMFLYNRNTMKDGEKSFFSLELGPLFQYNSGNELDVEESKRKGTLVLSEETRTSWDVLLGLVGYYRRGRESYVRLFWLFHL